MDCRIKFPLEVWVSWAISVKASNRSGSRWKRKVDVLGIETPLVIFDFDKERTLHDGRNG